MYDHFHGEVIESAGTSAVLRCGGVGYEIRVPIATAARLRVGSTTILHTILHVVDGAPTLLGFATRAERELARRILAVSGVGPTMVLAILSTFDPPTFGRMILADDAAGLRRVKGIGAKTAERLCLELRDRIGQLDLGPDAPTAPDSGPPLTSAAIDAIAALVTLGYAEKDARQRVAKAVASLPDAPTERLVKNVLRS